MSKEGIEFDTKTFIKYASGAEKIIVDEFHRAKEDFFAALQGHMIRGNMILITSTLHFSEKKRSIHKFSGYFQSFRLS